MPDTTTAEDPTLHALRDVAGLWWLTAAIGLLSIAAGVIVLIEPGGSLKVIAIVAGIFILIDGIVALLAAISHNAASRGLAALVGVLSLVVGVFLIRDPIHGIVAIALFFAIWLIAIGALRFLLAFDAPDGRTWRLVIATVEIVAGVVIVIWPKVGLATLAILIGVSLIINGMSVVALGFAMRSIRQQLPSASRGI
ncbi:MAG: HdeD family acid-resistance protein [Solirubrobacteraceae bacterium]